MSSTFGERLRRARKRCGMSQIDAAEAIGLSNKSLSRYEKDDGAPNPGTIMRLSRLYDVSSEYLLGLTTVMGHSSDTAQDGENLIDMTDNRRSAERLISFIASSPTMFHAVENIAEKLKNEGFTQLNEWDSWQIEKGGKYFTTRNGSSLIAFRVGARDPQGFSIFSAHSDSPMFKLKPSPENEAAGKYIRLNTEGYGGMIMPSWFDRPLSVAGRVAAASMGSIKTVLVNLSDTTVVIPNVAIHMQRNINDGMSYNPATDTVPLYGSLNAKGTFAKKVAEAAGVKEKDISAFDLYLYSKTEGTVWGDGGEFVSSPRLDDLQCAYAGMQAIRSDCHPDRIALLAIFDNEEVGSGTKQGARSDFLSSAAERIAKSLGKNLSEMLPLSFAVSADNAHAVHPNRPELSDRENAPSINGGIVIKHSARQSYATDAVSAALFKRICASVGVPVQNFANRSDMPGGGTLGNISTSQLSVATVDVGLAQLAMHSAYETAGSMDTLYLERAAAELFRTKITRTASGGYELEA